MIRVLLLCILMCGVSNAAEQSNGTRMKKKNVFFVILAGGSGERLWPLSKQKNPKQLLVVGQKTLLEQAIDRVMVLANSKENIVISTTKRFVSQIRTCAQELVGDIIVEPGAKDTGPAILYTCLKIKEKNPDALVVFVPADPYIPTGDNALFADCLRHAIQFVEEHDALALIGVHPTYPATGYGYIEFSDEVDTRTNLHKVRTFHEKPSLDVATYYLHLHNMLWNSGMFCGKVRTFIEEFATHAPSVYEKVLAHVEGVGSFDAVEKISVDYAIMEKSERTWVQPGYFSWCDVGNIGVLLALKEQHNTLQNNSVEIDAHNNLIDVPNRLVALIGVDDLCVVQTEDALLITKRKEAEKVRAVVNALRQNNNVDYL